MSPRAAWRLEALGFGGVYDYVAGKVDWIAAGLPSERPSGAGLTAGNLARRDVPTCRPADAMSEVQQRIRSSGFETCIVINGERVVLGRLGRKALSEASAGPVEDVMTEGPSTIRPYVPALGAAQRLREKGQGSALVTTSDGRLVGLLLVEDVLS